MAEGAVAGQCRCETDGHSHKISRCANTVDHTRYDGLCAGCGRHADLQYCEEQIAFVERYLVTAEKSRDVQMIERCRRAEVSLLRQHNELVKRLGARP